jgi:hypothetical protein
MRQEQGVVCLRNLRRETPQQASSEFNWDEWNNLGRRHAAHQPIPSHGSQPGRNSQQAFAESAFARRNS